LYPFVSVCFSWCWSILLWYFRKSMTLLGHSLLNLSHTLTSSPSKNLPSTSLLWSQWIHFELLSSSFTVYWVSGYPRHLIFCTLLLNCLLKLLETSFGILIHRLNLLLALSRKLQKLYKENSQLMNSKFHHCLQTDSSHGFSKIWYHWDLQFRFLLSTSIQKGASSWKFS
jgi:hypothetical protein